MIISKDKSLAENLQTEKQDKKVTKQEEIWKDISRLINPVKNNGERDYVRKGFEVVKRMNDKTIVRCPLWCSGTELNASGTGGHWRKHTTQLEKLKFTIEKDKINVICQRCNKKTKIYYALEHFKSQHYQDIQKNLLNSNNQKK